MNELVPDFQVDGDDYPISTSSALHRPTKSSMAEEEIMELLWQNGQVIMQSQTHMQKPLKKSEQSPQPIPDEAPPPAQQLFMQEDEMASWLHYPMEDSSFDRDLYSDLFYPPPPCTPVTTAPAPIPPPGPSLCPTLPPDRRERGGNFTHFSRGKVVREPTVGSNVTPMAAAASGGNVGRCAEQVGTSTAGGGGRETEMASPVGSGGSICASAERLQFPAKAMEDRKRKGVEVDGEEAECQSEDIEFESPEAKKQTRGSTSTKRSRAAEVHNLSERRRRDRINEKMKALQELIPRCNKSDKASMLDEAIEYLKSLQMQVQMMSMGCGMVPMMFPGVQPYMPPMGMGMGMGMGMEMGMNRPMMPFLPMMSGSALPNSTATGHMGPRFPMPAFHMQSVPLPNPSGTPATNQSDPMINLRTQNPNQPHMPFFSDPYQQYLGLQQVQLHQNQIMTQPSTSKPSSCREAGNHEDPKAGMRADRMRHEFSEVSSQSSDRAENDKNSCPADVGWLIQYCKASM